MSHDIYRSIRMSPLEVQALLSEMDARSRNAPKGLHPKREHARMEYQQDDVLVAIKHPGKTVARYLVTSRNLSAGGIAFLHGGFVHIGTACFFLLTDVSGERVKVVGTVRSCRHVSKSLHEVGVEFLHKIDPQLFCGSDVRLTSNDPDLLEMALPNLTGNALFVSENGDLRRSVTARLSATGMTVLGVATVGAALDQLRQVGFDTVVVDGAGGDVEQVRGAGYTGPIVCITEEGRGKELSEGMEVAAVLHHPVRAETLIGAVAGLMLEFGETGSTSPVHSLLAGKRGMDESIAMFVGAAQAAENELLDSLKEKRFERVRELCVTLRRDGSQTGFAVVGEAARRTLTLLDSDDAESSADVEGSVRFLARVCGRLREGVGETKPTQGGGRDEASEGADEVDQAA